MKELERIDLLLGDLPYSKWKTKNAIRIAFRLLEKELSKLKEELQYVKNATNTVINRERKHKEYAQQELKTLKSTVKEFPDATTFTPEGGMRYNQKFNKWINKLREQIKL